MSPFVHGVFRGCSRPTSAIVHFAVLLAVAEPVHTAIPEHGTRFGFSILVVPDLDADELPELLVGAPTSGDGEPGRVLMISSKTRKPLRVWAGEPGRRWFGTSLRDVGDVDDDGLPDVLVGYGLGSSATDVCSLADGSLLHRFDRPWSDLAPIGDADGDGQPDLLLLTRHCLETRRVRDGSLVGSPRFTERLTRFWPVGDVNGDGATDVLGLGKPGLDEDRRRGTLRLCLGGEINILEANMPALQFWPKLERWSESVYAVWRSRGADENGRPLLRLMAAFDDGTQVVDVVANKNGECAPLIHDVDRTTSNATPEYDGIGRKGIGELDIDGDGVLDLVVPGGVGIREVRVLAVSGKSGELCWTYEAPTLSRESQATVARFADANGDGTDDIVVGHCESRYVGTPEVNGQIVLLSGKDGAVLWKLRETDVLR